MQIPVIEGLIERRVLVNYRVAPKCLSRILPAPFEPKLVKGWGMAGICLIRLKELRPRGLPAWVGVGSENAAHRIAARWAQDGEIREGVYIVRRDTSSRVSALAGGRLFPGVHHHARFEVAEAGDDLRIEVTSDDGQVHMAVKGRRSRSIPTASVFESLRDASSFFESGSVGYSPALDGQRVDGLELRTNDWRVEPLGVDHVESSFFEDGNLFPPGSVAFDSALLMRGISHEWHARESLGTACCGVFGHT